MPPLVATLQRSGWRARVGAKTAKALRALAMVGDDARGALVNAGCIGAVVNAMHEHLEHAAGDGFALDCELLLELLLLLLVLLSWPGAAAKLAATEKGVDAVGDVALALFPNCLLYTSPSPRDRTRSRMPSSA